MRGTLGLVSVAVLLILCVLGTSIVARQARQEPDVLGALLVEVRGLRAAMEQLAAAGPRVQLAMGRLQLHEQRITTLVRRLDQIRDGRVVVEREVEQHKRHLSEIQESVRRSGQPPSPDAEDVLKGVRVELATAHANLQHLINEEVAITGQIATEQGRWSEINQRLEELDRALTQR